MTRTVWSRSTAHLVTARDADADAGAGRRRLTLRWRIPDVLVAPGDGVVNGYLRLQRPSPLAARGHVWLINGLAVDPSVQRTRITTALVEAALTRRFGGAARGSPCAPCRRVQAPSCCTCDAASMSKA